MVSFETEERIDAGGDVDGLMEVFKSGVAEGGVANRDAVLE